jgi:hypothetical protein
VVTGDLTAHPPVQATPVRFFPVEDECVEHADDRIQKQDKKCTKCNKKWDGEQNQCAVCRKKSTDYRKRKRDVQTVDSAKVDKTSTN